MNAQPLISIVMLNYNGRTYLERAVPALLRLTYEPREIIVVDNGSTDGSLEYLATCPVQVIQSPYIGAKNKSCNLGVSIAVGEYILLMDNDVVIEDAALLQQLLMRHRSLTRPGQIGLCFAEEGSTLMSSYGCYFGYSFTRILPLSDPRSFDPEKTIGFADGKAFFIEKKTWDLVRGYDESLHFGGDDNDLGIRLWLYGFRNYLYSNSVQTHLGMPERTDTEKFARKLGYMIHAHLHTILKNYRVPNAALHILTYGIFIVAKSIYQSLKRRSVLPLHALMRGMVATLTGLPQTFKTRKYVQSTRVIHEDIFLSQHP
jgi:GT2 family glycosyltransferase